MCMFARPVISVSATNIFARITASQTQFLAYQMSYHSDQTNAMILPIPVQLPASDSSVTFIDLSHYRNLFFDFQRGYPEVAQMSIGCSSQTKSVMSDLKVFQVGDYVASFVPTLSDFSRLDERFRLSDSVWNQLPDYQDFGFVVFQLAQGALKPHPMAFEFVSRKQSIFFPTRHVHDGEVHPAEDFDHNLFLQHAGLDSRVGGYQNCDLSDPNTQLIRSKQIARQFLKTQDTRGIISPDLLVHRKIIKGNYPNEDYVFSPLGHPDVASFNFRPWVAWSPWLLAVAGLSWFFTRRERIRRARMSKDNADHS